jgi:hypothetical protein
MVYGRYNDLVFMGFINPLTKLGGTILYRLEFTGTDPEYIGYMG